MKFKFILIIHLTFSCLYLMGQEKVPHNPFIKRHYKLSSKELSARHNWISFNVERKCFSNNIEIIDTLEYILHYNKESDMLFVKTQEGITYRYTNELLTIRNDYYGYIFTVAPNKDDKSNTYYFFGKMVFVPDYFSYIPYYIFPTKNIKNWTLWNAYSEVDMINIDNDEIIHYVLNDLSTKETIDTFVNNRTLFIDSVNVTYRKTGILNQKLSFFNYRTDNRNDYVDSVLNINIEFYDRYNEMNIPPEYKDYDVPYPIKM